MVFGHRFVSAQFFEFRVKKNFRGGWFLKYVSINLWDRIFDFQSSFRCVWTRFQIFCDGPVMQNIARKLIPMTWWGAAFNFFKWKREHKNRMLLQVLCCCLFLEFMDCYDCSSITHVASYASWTTVFTRRPKTQITNPNTQFGCANFILSSMR